MAHTTDLSSKQKLSQAIKKSNLRINPLVYWMKKNKQRLVTTNAKEAGPIGNQLQKSQKAKHLEDGYEINAAAAMTNEIQPTEIRDLISDTESDNSDELLVLLQPQPIFTVKNSAHEDGTNIISINLKHKQKDFGLMPQQIDEQSSTEAMKEGGDKRLEDVSRCTFSSFEL